VFSAKTYSLAGITVAAAALFVGAFPGHGHAAANDLIILAQQQDDPAAAGQTQEEPSAAPEAGAEDSQAHPAADGSGEAATSEGAVPTQDTEAPADAAGSAAQPSDDGSGAASGATPDNSSADVPPVAPETPTTPTEPSAPEASRTQSSAIDASQLQIGAPVFGSDGEKIGEVNGVKSDTGGKVQEILVTAGGAAGINAKVFAVSGDKIAEVKDGVKLSLTSEEAKQLPIIDNSNG
jgi:sporulation protein YlmC with PRC-barrel domain